MSLGDRSWLLEHAWLGSDDLAANVLVTTSGGVITSIEPDGDSGAAQRLPGVALPGLVNAHSHAFHRLLRGRTHRQGGDFWVWRELMYEVASSLTPESYEEIATAVFTEMAMAGITSVGEFHYVHHQPGGKPYDDPNEMGHALIRAARRAGIRIALLDACYLAAGFDNQQLHPVQERFSDGDADAWLDRVEALARVYDDDDDVVVGMAPHSVRAVPEDGLRRLGARRDPGTKVHIHVSEQPVENEACLEATGLTPVGLLARAGILGEGTTLVHATHLNPGDIKMLGDSGTGVCYCATTERDLADGIGPSAALHGAGSLLCVGSDSHAVIDLFEEARGLELHERLRSGSRGSLSPEDLAGAATVNGAAALGLPGGRLEEGEPADFTVVSRESARTAGATDLAGIIYTAASADVTDVIVGGEPVVSGGYHPGWEDARDVLGGLG